MERTLSDCLKESAGGWKFEVRLRLYAGWHSGKTPTPYHRGITRVMGAYASRTRSYHAGQVAFRGGDGGIRLGDTLACVPGRLARKHGVHLLDTLRHRDGRAEEKMVDTALAVDLLGLAHRKAADRYVVVSDDDDMLPGIPRRGSRGRTRHDAEPSGHEQQIHVSRPRPDLLVWEYREWTIS